MNNYLLSIDGSTTASGWAIFNKENLELVEYGVIKVDRKDGITLRDRVTEMIDGIEPLIKSFKPTSIVMEDVPPSIQNSMTVLGLGILSGAVLGLSHAYKVPITYLPVATWHSQLNFYNGTKEGKKSDRMKQESIKWANNKFGLSLIYKSPSSKFNEDNQSDAICIGCYHLGNYEKKEVKPKRVLSRKSK